MNASNERAPQQPDAERSVPISRRTALTGAASAGASVLLPTPSVAAAMPVAKRIADSVAPTDPAQAMRLLGPALRSLEEARWEPDPADFVHLGEVVEAYLAPLGESLVREAMEAKGDGIGNSFNVSLLSARRLDETQVGIGNMRGIMHRSWLDYPACLLSDSDVMDGSEPLAARLGRTILRLVGHACDATIVPDFIFDATDGFATLHCSVTLFAMGGRLELIPGTDLLPPGVMLDRPREPILWWPLPQGSDVPLPSDERRERPR